MKNANITLKAISITLLNFFNEEVIIKGFFNEEEKAKESSFKLYENENDNDFFIINNKEIIKVN